ncbi:hypothetical protein HKD37_01G000988 [Glycine soja]
MQLLMMSKRIHLIMIVIIKKGENVNGSKGVLKVCKGFTKIVENLKWVARGLDVGTGSDRTSTTDVKRFRINTHTHEYELFRMNQYETIQDMQKRFTHIVNHLASLGKIFPNEDLINKVLRCLSRQWQPKVTEHEMELMRLHQHQENDKKNKEIALRASSSSIQGESDKEDLNEIEEDDDFRFFEDNDMDSSSDSENEIINLGLMAKDYENAFNDLHKESVKLAKLVSYSKKTISNLEKEIMKLNVELENLKSEVKILKSVDKKNQSSTKCLVQENNKASHSCECCDKFKEEIEDLKNALTKFTLGKNNLDIILGKQRCVFHKARLGYNPEYQQKMHKNFFASTQKASSPLLTCFYCGKKDHSASTCYIKKNGSNIGKMLLMMPKRIHLMMIVIIKKAGDVNINSKYIQRLTIASRLIQDQANKIKKKIRLKQSHWLIKLFPQNTLFPASKALVIKYQAV